MEILSFCTIVSLNFSFFISPLNAFSVGIETFVNKQRRRNGTQVLEVEIRVQCGGDNLRAVAFLSIRRNSLPKSTRCATGNKTY